ncbi:MAG TPA: isoprenylcysteine carboxylmethyltransferase family protein [Candidatus Acidoferrales bacterium]|nr:isoprenylcysteine carboxylmethyltransferase family protein [Candidatus Acidoferrales bacterium]
MSISRLILAVLYTVASFGVPLFLPAWTLDWPRAWIFLGITLLASVLTMWTLSEGHEELLRERFKGPIQKGQPMSDRIVLLAFVAAFYGLLIFIPLDVFRFHLLRKPGRVVSTLGLVLFVAGWWIMALALRENAFAAPVVKDQKERHQVVVDTGVYAIVRHPMYAGFIPLTVGMALWLESYAAALLASVPILLIAVRIRIEERFLRQKLDGYDAYTRRVRYRLLPYIF